MDPLGLKSDIQAAEAAGEKLQAETLANAKSTAESLIDYACNKLAAMLEGAAAGLRKEQ